MAAGPMAVVPPAQLGSLWSTLEDQRGGPRGDVSLLSSAWSLPGDAEDRAKEGPLRRAWAAVVGAWDAVAAAAVEMWAFSRADRRKPIFAAKVGLALALISLLVFLREPHDIVSHSVWAILTVVVVFEFSIGTSCVNTFTSHLIYARNSIDGRDTDMFGDRLMH